jgi:hypothetical protein
VSTVLWANVLSAGTVRSDQSDLPALYAHADKLDAITRSLGLIPFLSICDMTDVRFNQDDIELPDGMESTNDLMAEQGVWAKVPDAIATLHALRQHIVAKSVRFGLLRNQHQQVVDELDEVIAFATAERASSDQFNFAVIM